MVARVVPLFRRQWQSRDWTIAETAEFYRIEHSLIQARLAIQTDRGVTDDGDPWFVFCRADGEVFVHIARFDGEYHLYSPALPSPLRGRIFSDLSKSFLNQIPLHLPVRNGADGKLFVHPAAALAIIIGTILIASDDGYSYVDDGHHGAGLSAPASEDRVSAAGAKATLQAALLKIIETYFGGARLEFADHGSAFLNIVCAIAACVIGVSISGDSHESALLVAADAPDDATAQTHVTTVGVVENNNELKLDALAERTSDTPQANHVASQVSQFISIEQDDDANGGGVFLKIVSVPSTEVREASVSVLQLDQHHDRVSAFENGNGIEAGKFALTIGSGQFQNPSASVAVAQNANPPPAASPTTTKGQPDVTSASAEQGLHSVLVGPNLLFSTESHAPASAQLATAGGPASLQQVVNSALGGVHPAYDASVQALLVSFWGANPHAQAVYDQQNMILYDGATPLAAAEVHVWDLGHGAVIAVVGHADSPSLHGSPLHV